MHSQFVLVCVQDQQDKSSEYIGIVPPNGLFSRIMKRLGLEQELILTKKNLSIFILLFVVFLFLLIFGFIGLMHELAESSFGQFISLIFSDPGAAITYWHSLMLSLFESMPSLAVSLILFLIAFLMIFIRLAVFAAEKISVIIKAINKQKYGHK